jgi:DNA repair photolyase
MKLNKSKGNMYEFVTHTGNVIKGICPHDCSYCYVKKWGNLKPPRLDEKELHITTPEDNFIFVGSGIDMFANEIPKDWILKTLDHCNFYPNKYLFQTKNPQRLLTFQDFIPKNSVVCTTIETNRFYDKFMGNTPIPYQRVIGMYNIKFLKYVTIEPIMDFDIKTLVMYVKECDPIQVNIGADSGGNKLPEPSKDKILELIETLKTFTKVVEKSNLKRLLK